MTISTSVERLIAFPITPLFDLIADIEAYPTYMPGWRSAHIIKKTATHLYVKQTVSLAGLRVTFNSVAEVDPPHRLEIHSNDAPFQSFRMIWLLTARAPTKTLVHADLDVVFRSRVLDLLAARMMPIVLHRAIAAFEHRAMQSAKS